MPQPLSDSIGQMVRSINGIREAYLPQWYVAGVVEPPAQILVLVLDDTSDPRVLEAVDQGLVRLLPQGMHLDVWPLTCEHSLLGSVRETRTHVHCKPPVEPKRWWKIPVLLFVIWFVWEVGRILFAR
jgi:hypothetical protein